MRCCCEEMRRKGFERGDAGRGVADGGGRKRYDPVFFEE